MYSHVYFSHTLKVYYSTKHFFPNDGFLYKIVFLKIWVNKPSPFLSHRSINIIMHMKKSSLWWQKCLQIHTINISAHSLAAALTTQAYPYILLMSELLATFCTWKSWKNNNLIEGIFHSDFVVQNMWYMWYRTYSTQSFKKIVVLYYIFNETFF